MTTEVAAVAPSTRFAFCSQIMLSHRPKAHRRQKLQEEQETGEWERVKGDGG
jgi:hypothetical protein